VCVYMFFYPGGDLNLNAHTHTHTHGDSKVRKQAFKSYRMSLFEDVQKHREFCVMGRFRSRVSVCVCVCVIGRFRVSVCVMVGLV